MKMVMPKKLVIGETLPIRSVTFVQVILK